MPSECDHVTWGWESCQYDSQCIFINYMSQTKSVKRMRMTFTCASGHTALSDECGWTFSWIILLWFGRTPTLGGKGCQWQISWDALADFLRVQCTSAFFPSSNHEHNTQEKHWVSYWIAIAALQAISCQLSWRFTDTHSQQNNKQHWSALPYSLLQTGGFSCGSSCGFYVWRSFHFRSGDDRWQSHHLETDGCITIAFH